MTGDAFATDSSGFHLFYDYAGYTIKIYAPDGTIVRNAKITGYETDAQGHLVVTKDPNGNYLSMANDAKYIHDVFDTLGRIPAQYSQCGAGGGPCFDIANSQADTARSHYVVNKATIAVHTGFGQSGVTEFTGNLSVVQSITLPDGTSYGFKYDCDSSLNSQVCHSPSGLSAYYGVLTAMTLPTGGEVDYVYTTFSDAYSYKSRWLTFKSGSGGSWTYTPQVISTCTLSQVGCQQKLTVKKPTGESSVYTFTLDNGAWLAQTQQLDPAGNLMATVANTWDFTNACVLLGCHGHNFISMLTQTFTVPVSGGGSLTKKTAYSYDTPQKANITAVKEWKFYPGTSPTFPSVPDRARYITYYNAGANIINKPLNVTLCNNSGSDADCVGGGSKVSQTKVTYDSYGAGLTNVSGISNHDDTNFGVSNITRGNPTQIQQWVSGTTYLTTQSSFDTTGQTLQLTDPAGNATTVSYADNFFTNTGSSSMSAFTPPAPTNAYAKTITLGGLTTTFGYYFGSGKRAISTDPNNQTSSSYFFDADDRVTQSTYPIGWNLLNYTSPTQVDTYVPVGDSSASSGCTSCRHKQINFDSWGRKINAKLANAPGGAINVDTTYDGNSRVASVSHAYVNMTDPSYVFETTAYDGLGRTTAQRHPDNQSVQNSYGVSAPAYGGVSSQQGSSTTYGSGYPILTTDESGKQKQKWIDGFGRLIEVDEPSAASSTLGTATVTIGGVEGSEIQCPPTCSPCRRSCSMTVWDAGTVSVTVGGTTITVSYGQSSTSSTIAGAIAGAFNGYSNSPATAAVNGSVITLTGRAPVNYSLSASVQTAQGFNPPSFTATTSGAAFTGATGGISSSPLFTNYLYDAADNLIQVVQGVQSRTFAYDGLGRLITRTTPEAGTENVYYTKSDNVSLCAGAARAACRRTDARGITTTYTYDSLSRPLSRVYSNGQGSVTYQYDQGGAAAFALGRRTSLTDPSGSETYTYNKMGWITQLQKTIGTTTFTTQYQYNTAGQNTQITYPSNRVIQQNVDNIGLPISLVSGATTYASVPEPPTGYNAAMQLLAFTYGNGVTSNFAYSPARQQMTSLSYTKGAQILFNLNYFYQNDQNCPSATAGNNGQIGCIKDLVDDGRTENLVYDPLGRLASAVTNGSVGYAKWGMSEAFDRYGNRLTQAQTYGAPPANSLSFGTNPTPPGNGAYTNHPDTYSFDPSGNMLNDGSNNLGYDAENCLTSAGSTTYTCDAHGIRVKKALLSSTNTAYIFSGGKDIAEYDYTTGAPSPGSPTREYIYLGSQLIATIQGTTTTYHHADHLSVRVTSDSNGNKIGEQGHYPYGELWYATNTTTKFIFTSYERDAESGNDYAMARYYINRFGRFCSADPVMGNPNDPQSWNRYAYVRNDPVNGVDPSGKSLLSWLAKALQFLVAAITGLPNGGPGLRGTPPTFPGGPLDTTTVMLKTIYNPVPIKYATPPFLDPGSVYAPDPIGPPIADFLNDCTNQLYGVKARFFKSVTNRSADGAIPSQNGLFGGTVVKQMDPSGLAAGSNFTVFTDASHVPYDAGDEPGTAGKVYTNAPYTDYVAGDFYNIGDTLRNIQLVELGNSLTLITKTETLDEMLKRDTSPSPDPKATFPFTNNPPGIDLLLCVRGKQKGPS